MTVTNLNPSRQVWFYNCPQCGERQNLFERAMNGSERYDTSDLVEAVLTCNVGGYLSIDTGCKACGHKVIIDIGVVADELRVLDNDASFEENYLDITTEEEE